jgi:VanZ family protein
MFIRYSLFAILWSLVILLLCGLPGSGFPDLSLWDLLTFDKFAHAFVYAVFSFLWAISFAKQNAFYTLATYPRVFALIAGVLYGIFIEVLQQFVFTERSAELNDVIANSTGAVIGIGLFSWVYRGITFPVKPIVH